MVSAPVGIRQVWARRALMLALGVVVQTAFSGAASGLRIEHGISQSRVWERQQLHVYVDVYSEDSFFSLRVPEVALDGIRAIPLRVRQRTERIEDRRYTVKRAGWALFPLQGGPMTLALPPIEYARGGRVQKRIEIPRHELHVRALPSYIPPTMPVGPVQVRSSVTPASWPRTGTLAYLSLTVSGEGVPAAWLPPVLGGITGGEDLQVFASETRKRNETTDAGVRGVVRHHIPLKPRTNGSLALPDIRFQYFDPDSGRLVSRVHEPPRPFSLGVAWRVILGIAVVVLSLIALRMAWRLGTRGRERLRIRRQAHRLLERADTLASIRKGLQLLARSHGWPANMTLRQWLGAWENHYGENTELREILEALEYRQYAGKAGDELQQLGHELLRQLRRPRPGKRSRSGVAQSPTRS